MSKQLHDSAHEHNLPWRVAFRLNSFRRAGTDVAAALRGAAAVPGVSAIELNYPQHFRELEFDDLAGLLRELGLPLTALNMRFDDARFRQGAFTAPSNEDRVAALAWAREAVETASRFGAEHMVLWMEHDGWDYALQASYNTLWQREIDGFRAVAAHDQSIRVSVEYKPYGSRRFALIRTMADALLAARDVDLPNFGVTIDLCHSYMAGEHPPAAAASALREGRLFGVHLNDGGGLADDGLMFATVHERDALELLTILGAGRYDGTLYFDTFPEREDPSLELAANIATLRRLMAQVTDLDRSALERAQAAHDALVANAIVESA